MELRDMSNDEFIIMHISLEGWIENKEGLSSVME
jgi:hypothetical protein